MSDLPRGMRALSAALAAFDVGEVLDLTPLAGEHRSRPLVATTASGRWFVKQLGPRAAAPPAVRLRHGFVGHLSSRGLRVPRFRRTLSGEDVLRAGGRAVEVQEFVEGRPLSVRDPCDAALAGKTLAELHEAGADFMPPGLGAGGRGFSVEDELAQLRRLEQQMQTYLPAPEVIAAVEVVRRALVRAGHELSDGDLPAGVIHGDFQPQNLLRAADGTVWVTSFDACRWGPWLLDAMALRTACGERALAAYAGLRPLTEAEGGLTPLAEQTFMVLQGLARGASLETLARVVAPEASE
jgi:homoserine kinase type II